MDSMDEKRVSLISACVVGKEMFFKALKSLDDTEKYRKVTMQGFMTHSRNIPKPLNSLKNRISRSQLILLCFWNIKLSSKVNRRK